MSMSDRPVTVVTGRDGGIGAATAEVLAAAVHHLVLGFLRHGEVAAALFDEAPCSAPGGRFRFSRRSAVVGVA